MSQHNTIRQRVILVLGLLLGGILTLAATGITGVSRMRDTQEAAYDGGFQPSREVLVLHRSLYKLRGDVYKILLLPEDAVKIGKDVATDLANIDSSLARLVAMGSTLDDSAPAQLDSSRAAIVRYRAAVEDIVAKAGQGDIPFGKESMKTGEAHLARKRVDLHAGALLGTLEIHAKESDERAIATGRRTYFLLGGVSLVLLILGAWAGFSLIRQVLDPLSHLVAEIGRIGRGDFRPGAVAPTARGEILAMIEGLDRTREALRGVFGGMAEGARSTLEATKLDIELTGNLLREADLNESRSRAVATAIESASSTLTSISDEASGSMNSLETVSVAIEEMSSSVREISRSADETRAMTQRALEGAKAASHRMDELAGASKEIEAVIEMIVEISEQTKLLALNATIEAARAGEAGKGFAVVAGEVKELAKGTAEATEDIRKRVETMRNSTANAVSEIATVSDNMDTLGRNITTIAGAVEEQSATTREIARSVGLAVDGTRAIHRSLGSGAKAVSEIGGGIREVLDSGKVLRSIATRARELADGAEGLARKSSEDLERFRI